jgi:phage protein D
VPSLRFVPDFVIQINGKPISRSMRAAVSSVHYQDGIEGADRVELTLVNDSLRWFTEPSLKNGNSLSLSMGYVDDMQDMFSGAITGLDATFPGSGVPTLTVVAHDPLNQMTHGNVQINWPSMPDPAIVRTIAGKYGLIPDADSGGLLAALISVVEYILDGHERRQSVSDFEFLSQIAREYGLDMYIDPHRPNVLLFSGLELSSQQPVRKFVWRQDGALIDFTPRLSTVGQVFGVGIRVYIQETGTEVMLGVGVDTSGGQLGISLTPVLQAAVGGALDYVGGMVPEEDQPLFGLLSNIAQTAIGQGLQQQGAGSGDSGAWIMLDDASDPAVAVKMVMGELTRRLNQRLTGSGSTVGDPHLRAGTDIEIEGLGEKSDINEFNGKYRVTSASHTIDSGGYRTSFEARKVFGLGGTL